MNNSPICRVASDRADRPSLDGYFLSSRQSAVLRIARSKGHYMSKGRMEAFSDGVLAIIITIMVLEMTVPHEADLAALLPLVPVFLSYVLSFVFVGIYWNNHHHMLQATGRIDGRCCGRTCICCSGCR